MAAVSPYKNDAWRRFRRQFIADNPVCVTPRCGGKSAHVDHILSLRRGGKQFDPANCQALCWRCHSRKTAMVDGGFGNPRKEGVSGIIGCDPDGNPLDPQHRWNRS